ncbi:MAG: hypothetical protein ACMXYB_04570 [Candidatus Woesearchaeota archaeon]
MNLKINKKVLNFTPLSSKICLRKGQIKFGETFAVMIVVFFAFIFGAQFYVSSLESSFEESLRERQQTQALERLEFALNYDPFLRRSLNNQERIYNLLSIQAFSKLDNVSKNRIFRESEIIVRLYKLEYEQTSRGFNFEEFNNFNDGSNILVLHNNTRRFYSNSGQITATNIIPHSAIINIYDPVNREVYTGILEVRSFY